MTAGSDAQKATYLDKLIGGRWTGTMNLTEPQAGSDLAQVRTRAVPQADGRYRVFGQKIYITYGEHDMAENIVHLVLARTPDAPAGVKGISLFTVPKIAGERGRIARRAQRRLLRVDRAQARHQGEPDGGAAVRRRTLPGRRRGRRDRRARRRGEPRPRVHVRHDERRALPGRHAGHRDRRSRVPAGGGLREGPRAVARRRRLERTGHDHPSPRRASDADVDARAGRGGPRARVRHGRGLRRRASPSGRRRAPREPGRLRVPRAGREGLEHRAVDRGRVDRRAGARRHGLHRGDRRGAALPRRAHPDDLRRHDRDPGERPRRSQDRARRRRDREGDPGARAYDGRRPRERGGAVARRRPRRDRATPRRRRRRARRRRRLRGREREERHPRRLRGLGAVPEARRHRARRLADGARGADRGRASLDERARRRTSTARRSRPRASTRTICCRRRRRSARRSSKAAKR